MSGLMGSLASAARALEAQRFGLDVAGQNIANVNTPGYSRREALLASVPGTGWLTAGNGVEVTGIRSSRDLLLSRRLLRERGAEQREAAVAGSLALVETAIGKPGESVDAALGRFFDAFGRLSAAPTSSTARQEVVLQGETLAASFKDMAQRLELARRDADTSVRAAAEQVNALVGRIASLNASLTAAGSDGSVSLHLKDELSLALDELGGLMDVNAIDRPDGGVDLSMGDGRPLVIGATPYALAVDSAPDGTAVVAGVSSGRIGGLLAARRTIEGYLQRLDTLAEATVSAVNAVHRAGAGLDGVSGRDFFSPVAATAGAASAISLSPAIQADPSSIAASESGAVGDNAIARQLANLRDQPVVDDGTVTLAEAWAQLVYRVGADTRTARDEQGSRAEIVRQVEQMREQVSGVSLDEEAMMMMKFQRAYEANARFFRAVGDALDTLMQALS